MNKNELAKEVSKKYISLLEQKIKIEEQLNEAKENILLIEEAHGDIFHDINIENIEKSYSIDYKKMIEGLKIPKKTLETFRTKERKGYKRIKLI